MSIVLGILKIIGVALLVILGLILVITALILLLPNSYMIDVEKYSQLKLNIDIKILSLVKIYGIWLHEDPDNQYLKVTIFGKKLFYMNFHKDKAKKKVKEKVELYAEEIIESISEYAKNNPQQPTQDTKIEPEIIKEEPTFEMIQAPTETIFVEEILEEIILEEEIIPEIISIPEIKIHQPASPTPPEQIFPHEDWDIFNGVTFDIELSIDKNIIYDIDLNIDKEIIFGLELLIDETGFEEDFDLSFDEEIIYDLQLTLPDKVVYDIEINFEEDFDPIFADAIIDVSRPRNFVDIPFFEVEEFYINVEDVDWTLYEKKYERRYNSILSEEVEPTKRKKNQEKSEEELLFDEQYEAEFGKDKDKFPTKELINVILTSEYRADAWSLVANAILKIVRTVRPKYFEFDLEIGNKNPEKVGRIIGMSSMFIGLYSPYGQIRGNFNEAGVWGAVVTKGRFNLFQIIKPCVKLIFRRSIRKYVMQIIRVIMRKD
ncbi:MAG: hypothetical protein ATN36_08045 [Epulopiscium sp. Nele67-Bin005]|nr:MAG: hypothetical protein ATN36_08045 [Epulopiscium sp. Nele67-Bin005]